MEGYLVQYGEAQSQTEDPRRSLTERGKAEVKAVARNAAGLRLKVSQIFPSGKLRAQQTAEILAQHLAPTQGVSEQKGLAPLDDPRVTKERIQQAAESIMLVGATYRT